MSNIFTSVFKAQIAKIISNLNQHEIHNLYQKTKLNIENVDLGQQYYELLIICSGEKLIDFKDFDNNSLHVVTENGKVVK